MIQLSLLFSFAGEEGGVAGFVLPILPMPLMMLPSRNMGMTSIKELFFEEGLSHGLQVLFFGLCFAVVFANEVEAGANACAE